VGDGCQCRQIAVQKKAYSRPLPGHERAHLAPQRRDQWTIDGAETFIDGFLFSPFLPTDNRRSPDRGHLHASEAIEHVPLSLAYDDSTLVEWARPFTLSDGK